MRERESDEPSYWCGVGRLALGVWVGGFDGWRLAIDDERVNQNPHWKILIGPFAAIWWIY